MSDINLYQLKSILNDAKYDMIFVCETRMQYMIKLQNPNYVIVATEENQNRI